MSIVLKLGYPCLSSSQLLECEQVFKNKIKFGHSSIKHAAKFLCVTYAKTKPSIMIYGPCIIQLPISSLMSISYQPL